VRVVVIEVLAEDDLEVTATEDQHPVEAFTTKGADDPLAGGVGTRSPDRGPHDSDAVGAKDLVEGPGELGVAIAAQEPDGGGPF